MNRFLSLVTLVVATGSFVLCGCDTGATRPAGKSAQASTEVIAAERAKLSPEDRTLVEAQEWCVVQNDERLGSMGAPIKLDIKGQPVFVCCKSCKTKAEKDPEATLAKVEELKVRARSERGAK